MNKVKNSFSKFGYGNENSLLKSLGSGILTVREIFEKINPKQNLNKTEVNELKSEKFFNFNKLQSKGIILDGIDNILIHFGKCCNPIPGDEVIGL